MLDINNQSANSQLFASPLTANLIPEPNIINQPAFTASQATTPQTIAFIDSNVTDATTLITGLEADIKIFLDPTQDGITQITQTLEQYKDITGISIISHGNVAQLQLGNSVLSTNSLAQYAPELQQWKASLTDEADVLIYGCNVAAGETGQTFVQNLSELTDADIAASTNLTGNTFLGGDYILEYNTGNIETTTPFTASLTSTYQGLLASLFDPTLTPSQINLTDGVGSNGDYELGMEFRSNTSGQISAIRYYKAPNETGTHIGKIWSSTGQLLASVTFTNETASGWQQQTLATPLTIQPNTTYVVSVNVNSHYVVTPNGLGNTITNGALSAVADGSNGVYNYTPGNFPTESWNNTNYFRDIVFTPGTPPANNNPGSVSISGTVQEDQTLSATVADADGLTGATINYQWQQQENNTWVNIAGATGQALILGDAQVNKQVRVRATYIDALGSSENITSTATAAASNVNDLGTVAISGLTSIGNTVTANVTDADGLTGASINYQWQKLVNGTWSNISGATNQTLNLDNTLLGQQIRVNTVYTDVLGGSENIFSPASNPISDTLPAQTFFTPTVTPVNPNFTDGIGVDYELGMRFTPLTGGYVHAIRYYKSPSETGTHVGRIWSSTGQLLASVNFTNETASGWQEQVLATPLTIAANQTYVVSVNANSYYASSTGGFANPITNGSISTGVGAGVYNETVAVFPNASYQNENYYRDIVFTPANNHPGSATISGTVQEDQIVTANVVDTDGANGAAIAYQWQQLENNTWSDIAGATKQTFTLGDRQVAKQVRVKATYTDALGVGETVFSNPTSAVINVNDQSLSILRGSATVGQSLIAGILDDDGLGATINYQWQQLESGSWNNIAGATSQTFTLTNAQINKQVRATATYTDGNNTFESVATSGTTVAALNPIVVENQKQGTTAWQIANLAANNEIAGYAGATSVNQGEVLPIKVSLAQPGQYKIDVYRLGYYGGAGGRLITSSGLLNGTTQSGPIFDPNTRLVEYNWNTSYNLQVGNDWTSGLYIAEMTDIRTGKESQVWFAVRDDDRPADLGFQASFTTYEAYNNYGGYSTYTSNSIGEQRAFKVSFNRPMAPTHQGSLNNDGYNINNMIAWEYNMVAWLESQGYDVSYYTNLDVHTNPLQLFSQKTFLSVGHDEYWSMEMFDNIEKARDNGINLGFFSANTAYWRVRFEPSSTGEPNRVMVSYKSNWALDPVAQNDISQATTVFRSPELNRPENSLLGVAYIGNTGSGDSTGGFDWVVSNSSDPYYAHTGLKNGDILTGLVGYEWDAVLNNGFSPSGLVVLSQSPVTPQGSLPLLPPGTNLYISNGVRYTAPSGAKVFSTGTIQWPWGLYGTSRTDPRVKQITANVLADMGAKPQTPSAGLIV